jgi:hypothetical protein
MDRQEFEQMSRTAVYNHAREEKGVQRGKPLYHGRPWSRVFDEMVDAEAPTVGALGSTRITMLHEAINPSSTTEAAPSH